MLITEKIIRDKITVIITQDYDLRRSGVIKYVALQDGHIVDYGASYTFLGQLNPAWAERFYDKKIVKRLEKIIDEKAI